MIRCTVLQSSSNSMNSHRQAFMYMKRYTVWGLSSRLLPSDSKKHVHVDRPNFDPRPCFTHALNIPTCSCYWTILTPEPARFRSAVTNCFYKPLLKIRVETQATCLAQLVLSCMNTLLDLSSSVSTSVLWKRTRNVILRRLVQGYHMAYLDQWWNRERKINCWLSLVVENSP